MISSLQKIDQITKSLLILLTFILFIIPKYNIISVSTYKGAGLRIDDFLLALVMFLFCIVWLLSKKLIVSQVEKYFYLFIFISIISFLTNAFFSRGSILYIFRLIEYWIFFYLGSLIPINKEFKIFLLTLFSLNGLVVVLQSLNLVGGFSDGIYHSNLYRPTGLTNGAYEVPMIFAIVFTFFLGFSGRRKPLFIFLMLILSNYFIYLTAARIPFIAINLAFILFLKKNFNILTKTAVIFAACLIFIIVSTLNISLNENSESKKGAISRITNVLNEESVTLFKEIYELSPESPDGIKGPEMKSQKDLLRTENAKESLQKSSSTGDLSLMVRLNKWMWAIKTFLNQNIIYFFLGLAPGSMGNALDGGILRILIETGILGLIAFFLFLKNRPKTNNADPLFYVVFVFIIGNIFIDYYLSYKVIALTFFAVGSTQSFLLNQD